MNSLVNKLFELVITLAMILVVIYLVACLVDIAIHPGAFPHE